MAAPGSTSRLICFASPTCISRLPAGIARHYAKQSASCTTAKLKVEVLTLGKRNTKDAVYDAHVGEYVKRMSHTLAVSERCIKPEGARDAIIKLRANSSVMLLDESGTLPKNSVHFSEMVFKALEDGGSRLVFVIGGSEGLPPDTVSLKGPRVQIISLSPLTFTHKMVRLFLYEQLYRVVEIRSKSGYHK